MKENIKLLIGKIWEQDVDAIISPANNESIVNAPLAAEIFEQAGDSIIEEVNTSGKLELGNAMITEAGDLKAKYIIHAACLDFSGKTSEPSVVKATRNAMLLAQEKNLLTVSFPPFVVSSNDIIPPRRCAELMISEVIRTTEREDLPEMIYFVLPDTKLYKIYEESLMMI